MDLIWHAERLRPLSRRCPIFATVGRTILRNVWRVRVVRHDLGPADRHRGRPCSTTLPPHKHRKVLAWLSRHPRWIFHFTPTSASWLNAVENFFSKMTRQFVRRGVPIDCRSAGCHQRLLAQHNAQRQTVRLDQNRRGNPGQTR
jgi:hypothetical protein